MAEEHHISVARTARYYTLGTLSEQTTHVWFVLHGYGQLARYFIRRFDVVANPHTLIVAPEALSRFYTDAEYGKIGASWLTREARDQEVADFVTYLDSVWQQVLGHRDPATLHITLMGFSQGASTACRWLEQGRSVRADRLMLWAGYFLNGLHDVLSPETVANVTVEYVYGREDEYIGLLPDTDTYLAKLRADIPNLWVVPFEGKHVVDRQVLAQLTATPSPIPE